MEKFIKRVRRAVLVFWNDGVLVSFNQGDKHAVLKIKELPAEGDTLTVGNLTAKWTAKPTSKK